MYGGSVLISEKTEVLYAGLNKRGEAASSSFLQAIFYNTFIHLVVIWETSNDTVCQQEI